jgi:hypothetical protein
MARYSYTGDRHEHARKAEEGILPIFEAQPGFKSYALVANDDEVISFSAWETSDQAEAANAVARDWIADNMADTIQLKEVKTGEILLSTALGVTTGAIA